MKSESKPENVLCTLFKI